MTNVSEGIPWYTFSTESFTATVLQWAVLLIVMGVINVGVIYCQSRQSHLDKTEEKHLELEEDSVTPADYGAVENKNADVRSND